MYKVPVKSLRALLRNWCTVEVKALKCWGSQNRISLWCNFVKPYSGHVRCNQNRHVVFLHRKKKFQFVFSWRRMDFVNNYVSWCRKLLCKVLHVFQQSEDSESCSVFPLPATSNILINLMITPQFLEMMSTFTSLNELPYKIKVDRTQNGCLSLWSDMVQIQLELGLTILMCFTFSHLHTAPDTKHSSPTVWIPRSHWASVPCYQKIWLIIRQFLTLFTFRCSTSLWQSLWHFSRGAKNQHDRTVFTSWSSFCSLWNQLEWVRKVLFFRNLPKHLPRALTREHKWQWVFVLCGLYGFFSDLVIDTSFLSTYKSAKLIYARG